MGRAARGGAERRVRLVSTLSPAKAAEPLRLLSSAALGVTAISSAHPPRAPSAFPLQGRLRQDAAQGGSDAMLRSVQGEGSGL